MKPTSATFAVSLAATLTAGLAAGLFLGTTASAFAADKPKAPFEVIVTSPEGAPVADADVAITSTVTVPPYSFTGKTDAEGKAAGELADFKSAYTVNVSKEGFKSFSQEVDFATTKFKKGEPVSLKVTLPAIPAGEYFNEGAKTLREGDYVAAQTGFEKAIAADPKLAVAHSALAQAHLAQADPAWLNKKKSDGSLAAGVDVATETQRHAEAGLAAADTALTLNAEDPLALGARYEALGLLGRAEEAQAALAVLAEKVPTPATAVLLFNAGAQAANAKQRDVARGHFTKALVLDPSLYQAHNGLAELNIADQKYEEAVAELTKVIVLVPRNFKAHDRRLEVLKRIGDKDRIAAAEQELAKLKSGS